jgi:hypothetical protein
MIAARAARSTAAEGERIGFVGVLLAISLFGLAGCGSISEQTAATAFVAPGRYDINTCKEIEDRIRSTQNRVLELEQLMVRSAQGAGGQFVNAIAYQGEYQQARGQLKALGDTAADKSCASRSQWSSQRSIF